ncbi:MAG: helix-turn-helix domain-containing protein [Ruminococcaceae bacterium]|nr:helix-turn-helix domain-containing protein [Oscillospiraceae bacterium]
MSDAAMHSGEANVYRSPCEETLAHDLNARQYDGEYFSHRPYLSVPPYRKLDYNRRTPQWKMESHSHNYWQIFVVLSGSCFITCEGETVQLGTGEASILPPGIPHNLWAEEDYAQLGAAVQPQAGDAHNISAFLDENIHGHTVVDFSSSLEECRRTAALFRKNNPMAQLSLCARMDVLLLDMFSIIESDNYSPFLRKMDQYLMQHMAEHVSVEEAAREFHFSVSHLEKLCRHYYGCGMIARLTHLRLERACLMLESSAYPIKEIALAVGFRNPAHFTKVFKRTIGVTPEVFRADS